MNGEVSFLLFGALLVVLLGWSLLRLRGKQIAVSEGVLVTRPTPVQNADALILGDLNDPFLELTLIEQPTDSLECIKIDPAMRRSLQPLMQRAPELLRVGQDMCGKSFRLVFSPEVTRALNRGTLELVPSAGELLPVVRQAGGSKQFLKLGRAVSTGGIRLANVAAATWQIAAIATAQHFLTEINARLAGIEHGIDDIRIWLEEEKKADLRAAVGLLKEYYNAIARGDLHDHEKASIYHQLDDIERTCRSIGELALGMSKRRLEELNNLDIREWSDREGSAERAFKWIRHNREALDLIFLAQSVRILACQVKSSLPGDRQRLIERIEHATTSLTDAQQLFESTGASLDKKVQELRKRDDNPFAFGGLLDEDYRVKIGAQFTSAREHTQQILERLRGESVCAMNFTNRFQEIDADGISLDLRINDVGEIDILGASPKTA